MKFDIMTYRKGRVRRIAEKRFVWRRAKLDGRPVKYRLAVEGGRRPFPNPGPDSAGTEYDPSFRSRRPLERPFGLTRPEEYYCGVYLNRL